VLFLVSFFPATAFLLSAHEHARPRRIDAVRLVRQCGRFPLPTSPKRKRG